MRVLVVGMNYAPEPTGIAPYTTAFCRGLLQQGHRVRVLTTMPHYPEWRISPDYPGWRTRETVDGVPVERLRHYVPAHPSALLRVVSEVSFGLRVALSVWGRPDAVVFVSPALISSAVAVLGRVPRQPWIVWVQDVYSLGLQETRGQRQGTAAGVIRRLEGQLLRRATGVVVIHQRFVRVVEALGAATARVVVIRNWTHLKRREGAPASPLRERLGLRADHVLVVHSGAVGRKQDLGNVVAAARLAEQTGRPLHFLLVGDGSERSRLQALAAGLSTITFLDPVPDEEFQGVLAAADVLLVNEHAGLREMAVPSKLTSYFFSGRPIVAATDAGSVTAEELTASGAGIRIDPGDPAALVEAVLSVAADDAAAARFGEAGLRYQREVLSEDAALTTYVRWLEALVQDRGRRTPVDLLRRWVRPRRELRRTAHSATTS